MAASVRPRGDAGEHFKRPVLVVGISVSAVKIQACLPFGADAKRAKRTRTHFYYARQKPTILRSAKTDDMRPRLKRCIVKARRGNEPSRTLQ
jgi:hypothetical protein